MKKILSTFLVLAISLGVFSADVKVEWDHANPTNNIIGYKIYYGNVSRNYTNSIAVGYVTNTIVSLSPTAIVYMAATALDENNLESDFSNEILVDMSTLYNTNQSPSMVKDFTVTKVTQTIY